MKTMFNNIRDTFIAGVMFLLPLLVLFVLLSKAFHLLTGLSSRIAAFFGLHSFVGFSGGTIVSPLGIILLCIVCGFLVRIAFFKTARDWVDSKLMANIPGYSVYREMALSKLEEKEEALPYKSALWLKQDKLQQPGFLMEKRPDGKLIVFIPSAGNVKEGAVFMLSPEEVELWPDADMKSVKMAINNLGLGLFQKSSQG